MELKKAITLELNPISLIFNIEYFSVFHDLVRTPPEAMSDTIAFCPFTLSLCREKPNSNES